MSDRTTGYLYCTLAMATVGSTVVASKLIAAGLPPFTAALLRFALASPVFLVLLRITGETWPRLDWHDRLLLMIQAGAGSVGYTVLLIAGMRLASAADASVIAGSLPVVSAIFAVAALGERPSLRLMGAVGLATAGVLGCTLQAFSPAGGTSSLAGNLLVLAAVVCESLFILLNKRLRARVSPLQQSALMTGLGMVLAVVPAMLEAPWTLHMDATAFAGVAYYAIVPTVGGFLLWYAGASRLSGAEAGLFTAVAPVTAMLLAAFFLREQVTTVQLVGIGCVLAAVALTTLGGRPFRAA